MNGICEHEVIVMKNLIEKINAETNMLKKDQNTLQNVIFQIGKDIRIIKQEVKELERRINKKIISNKK